MREFVGSGDRGAGELAVLHADAGEQAGLALAGTGKTLIRDQFDKRIGDVGQRLGGGAGVCPGHIGDAVMHDTLLHIDGVVMGGGPGGFRAAALVNGDIDEDAARAHPLEHRAIDQLGGFGPRNEDRADEQVDVGEKLVQVGLVGKEGVSRVHGDVEEAHSLQIHLEDGDIRAEPGGHASGVDAGGSAADDHNPAGQNPGYSPQEHAAATSILGEEVGADDHRHAAGDLRHRLKQREATTLGHHLVGHGGDAGGQKGFGEFKVGGEMKIGEENLVFPEQTVFGGQGLFHLHDQIGGKGLGMLGHNFGTGLLVLLVGIAGANASVLFNDHLVTALNQLVGRGGKQGNPCFLGFDLFGNADDHALMLHGESRQASGETRGAGENDKSEVGLGMHQKLSDARLEELRKMDRAHHLHPFTDHAAMHPTGTHVITSGEGVYLYGEEGKLLDGLAGLWCVNVGYGRKEIADAVSKQIRELSYYPSFFNTTTEAAVMLADRLGRMAPGKLKYAVFSNSGSEANETGLKIIRQYQILQGKPNRTKILTRNYAYHGVTLATASMTGLPNCQQPFGLPLPGFVHAPAPYAYAVGREKDAEAYGQECVTETKKLIEKEGPETIGAMILEPVQGAGGVIVPPPGYLAGMRKLARDYGILFVCDEVISGFGRMGCWFLSEMWDLQPDLMILAKGLTSGYVPMGATMVAEPIAEALMKGGYFAHGFTYTGHPVSAAAALANLDIIEKEKLVERTRDKTGPYFQKKLQEFVGHPAVGEVRGLGLIGAMELLPKGGRKDLKPGMNLGILGAAKVRSEGAIVRGIRDLLAFSPPLVITEKEIDELFASVRRGIDKLWS